MTEIQHRKLTREEIAAEEVGKTEISRRLAVALVAVFLVAIVSVSILQHVAEVRRQIREDRTVTRTLSMYEIFRAFPEAGRILLTTKGDALTKVFAANAEFLRNINDYEDRLETDSVLSKTLIGPTQLFLLRHLGHGNEKVYPGRDGWLFFRPGIDYVTGPPFLNARRLAARRLEGSEYVPPPQPDPREAILDFHEELAERGIALIVVPAPVKASLYPYYFSARYEGVDAIVQNESFARLVRVLEAEGIHVFDPAPLLQEALEFSGMPQYLETDTHWKPGAMEIVARRLAGFISKEIVFAEEKRAYAQTPMRVNNLGDLARMLQLPESQELFDKEEVSIRQVRDQRSGALWRPNRSAEILLLGDSFSNIYSLPGMGWGQSAGLAEQLSFFLQRPIDVIIQNDNGAFATRQALSARQSRGDDTLFGKKVVIWQFAARELSLGDWKILE